MEDTLPITHWQTKLGIILVCCMSAYVIYIMVQQKQSEVNLTGQAIVLAITFISYLLMANGNEEQNKKEIELWNSN